MQSDSELTPQPDRPERFAIRRPVTIAMAFLATAVFGWQSFVKIPLSLMPDITYPTLTVRTELEGAAPEEVEDLVSKPIEEVLGTVGDLIEISSVSSAGVSEVVLEFSWDKNMDFAVLDVREKLDRVILPDEAERSVILRYNPALDPVMRAGVYSDGDKRDLYSLRTITEDEIKRELEGLTGVASAAVRGGLEEEIVVDLNESRAAQLGITVDAIASVLAEQNINLAGGKLKERKTEYLVRTRNEFVDPAEMADIVIGGSAEFGVVRLRDVATVERSHRERETITRIGGREAILVSIYKEADANTVATVRAVRECLDELFAHLKPKLDETKKTGKMTGKMESLSRKRTLAANIPDDLGYRVVSDQADYIEAALAEVRDTAVLGGILALAVLFVFLRDLRSTLIIGLAIPVSIVITFVPMFAFDVSLNIMSLGGLALGIGMLVDASIVVLENIFRLREQGLEPREAADRGVGEVASAITSSTLTTIAVFFPIVFVEGVAGQIFKDFALTVTFSLLGSLVTALYLIPMLASRTGVAHRASQSGADPIWLRQALADRRAPRKIGRDAWRGVRELYEDMRIVPFADRAVAFRVLTVPIALIVAVFQVLVFVAVVVLRLAGAILGSALYVCVGLGVLAADAFGRIFSGILGPVLDAFDGGFSRLAGAYPRWFGWTLRQGARASSAAST